MVPLNDGRPFGLPVIPSYDSQATFVSVNSPSGANMARLAGVEPATNGFEAHYSIQLSYRRTNLIQFLCCSDGCLLTVYGQAGYPAELQAHTQVHILL